MAGIIKLKFREMGFKIRLILLTRFDLVSCVCIDLVIIIGGTEYSNSVFMGQATNLVDIFDIPTNTWRVGKL